MITLYSRMLDSCYYAAVIAGLATGRQAIARSTLAHRFVILLSAPGSPPGYARFQRAGLRIRTSLRLLQMQQTARPWSLSIS